MLSVSSCDGLQPEVGILDYASYLPNYCVNDTHALDILESNAREYGGELMVWGVLGDWDGLLHSLILQHFLWGDYAAVVRIGDRYSKIRDVSVVPEYIISQYLIDTNFSKDLQLKNPHRRTLGLGTNYLIENTLLSFDEVQDLHSFEKWSNTPQGLHAILILACKLHEGRVLESNKILVLNTLLPLFVEGEPLDRFLRLTSQYAPWVWNVWLKSSLMLEGYARDVNDSLLVARIRDAREIICEGIVGTRYEKRWVNCILEERGVFSLEGLKSN